MFGSLHKQGEGSFKIVFPILLVEQTLGVEVREVVLRLGMPSVGQLPEKPLGLVKKLPACGVVVRDRLGGLDHENSKVTLNVWIVCLLGVLAILIDGLRVRQQRGLVARLEMRVIEEWLIDGARG